MIVLHIAFEREVYLIQRRRGLLFYAQIITHEEIDLITGVLLNLIPILNVEENMTLPILLDGKKPDKELLKNLVEKLGLKDRLSHLPNQLSGGQQQRVSIGRALMNNPALLLADEPTGNLDSENSREIISLLRKFNKENNQTVIIITHDEKIALSADRVITIEDGRITRDSKKEGVMAS